ncbi:MAG: D-alanyl-D-alanine carboxypeptidase [Sphingomonadales bacterium]|nr:D-alanyl-D-alanine carboxypeptidase [Sphingomonadales bacterium]MBD3772161.1 D-alanyl-D-alanine carboxypeptidase [Paracoccaceae bacterium]
MARLFGIVFAVLALALSGTSAAQSRASRADAILGNTPVALLAELPSGQVLYAREADRRFVPASVTKVMTVFSAFELIKAGKLDPGQAVLVDPDIADEWSGTGSTMFLKSGDEVLVDQLLHGITTISANDAAELLARKAGGSVKGWTDMMNANAIRLGMADSHFNTPNGWMDGGATFTTANDLLRLATALITRHPQLYRNYFGKPDYGYGGIAMRNHDPITGVVPGADGIKTGYTKQAGYNFLGSAQRGGRRLVMVLAGIEDPRDRSRIAREFIEWGFHDFTAHRIFDADQVIGHADVQGGVVGSVALVSQVPVMVSLPNAAGKPRLTIHYEGPLRAPIERGEQVAELEVAVPGMDAYRVPLVAAQTVGEAGFARRIFNGMMGWFA